MSICTLRGLNVKLSRRAFILANLRVTPPPNKALTRGAHNSLYQMCEPPKPCVCQNTKVLCAEPCLTGSERYVTSAAPQLQNPCNQNYETSHQNYGSNTNQSSPDKSQSNTSSTRQKYCQSNAQQNYCLPTNQQVSHIDDQTCSESSSTQNNNTPYYPQPYISPCPPHFTAAVAGAPALSNNDTTAFTRPYAPCASTASSTLRFSDHTANYQCRKEPRITAPKCPPPQPPKKDSSDDGNNNNTKLILAALAALGAGGLLVWFLTRKECKECEECPKPVVAVTSIPPSSSDLPKHAPYLLIGGGTAAFSAFRAIKSNDPKAKVLMLTNEMRKPYMRPPLSKELWYSAQNGPISKDFRFKQWTGAERSLYFEPDEFFLDPTKLDESANGGIAVAQGFTAQKINPTDHIVTLTDGYEITYDECLIATGCTPKNLPVFLNAPMSVKEKVMVYRTPDDFERLKAYADKKKSITIVGNGFIGSELACALATYAKDKDVKIFQVFQESGIMSRVLPDYLSRWTTKQVEALGVTVHPNASVRDARRDESTVRLTLNDGSSILTDVVVVCVGCEANTNIAAHSGLEVDRSLGGFVVNAELEARRNLFVAGDAACFYDPLLGRRRVEHHDHSVVSGRLAGENMVGKKKAYAHQSMFWSDLGPDIGYEGIGLVDGSLQTVGVFALPSDTEQNRQTDNLADKESAETNEGAIVHEAGKDLPEIKCDEKDIDNYSRGVIFYLQDEKIVGILLWNIFNRIGLARTIINQNKKFEDLNEVAKLFEIHT